MNSLDASIYDVATALKEHGDNLGDEDFKTLTDKLRVLRERKHYRAHPLEWMCDHLGVQRRTVDWSMNEDYREKGYVNENGYTEKWDGDPNPLYEGLMALAGGKDTAWPSCTGSGKALLYDAPVMTPQGWKKMCDLSIGDQVVGRDGEGHDVLGVYDQGVKQTYRVHFDDNTEIVCCGEHLWTVRKKQDARDGRDWRVLSTKEIIEYWEGQKERGVNNISKWEVPIPDPVKHPEKDFPVDPYVLGVLLGDGSLTTPSTGISTADEQLRFEVERRVRSNYPEWDVHVRHTSKYDYNICFDHSNRNPLREKIDEMGVGYTYSYEKEIPEPYFYGSVEQRLDLLRGLMDTDGTLPKNSSPVFCSGSEKLINGVIRLVRSLGGVCHPKRSRIPSGKNCDGEPYRISWRTTIKMPYNLNPFFIDRKGEEWKPSGNYSLPKRRIDSIEKEEKAHCACLKTSAEDSLFMTENYILTHNTHIAARIVCWYLSTHPYGSVYTVAPKESLLTDNLWAELGDCFDDFKKIHPQAQLNKLRLRVNASVAEKDSWVATGFVAGVGAGEEVANKAKGYHDEHMLFIIEETPGVDRAVLNAIKETCTGLHNQRLFLGNPSSEYDNLAKACKQNSVETFRISSYDHPNLVMAPGANIDHAGQAPQENIVESFGGIVPGAVTWKSIMNRRADRGEDHPLYKSQVRGIFPVGGGRSMVPEDVLRRAKYLLSDPVSTWGRPKKTAEQSSEDGYSKLGYDYLTGETRVYYHVKPTHANRYVVFSDVAGDYGDMAEGRDGDYHFCIVFDRKERRPAATIKAQGPRNEYVHELLRVAKMYEVYRPSMSQTVPPQLAWETNGVGALNIVEEMHEYPFKYHRQATDTEHQRKRAKIGWDTNTRTRDDMMDELENWVLKDLRTDPSKCVCKNLFKDLSKFVWNPNKRGDGGKWEAAPGAKDDGSMALAGSLMIAQESTKLLPIREGRETPNESKEQDTVRELMLKDARKARRKRKRKKSKRKTEENAWLSATL